MNPLYAAAAANEFPDTSAFRKLVQAQFKNGSVNRYRNYLPPLVPVEIFRPADPHMHYEAMRLGDRGDLTEEQEEAIRVQSEVKEALRHKDIQDILDNHAEKVLSEIEKNKKIDITIINNSAKESEHLISKKSFNVIVRGIIVLIMYSMIPVASPGKENQKPAQVDIAAETEFSGLSNQSVFVVRTQSPDSRLRVRDRPSVDESNVIGHLSNGQLVEVVERRGYMREIKCEGVSMASYDGPCYVHSEYLLKLIVPQGDVYD
ncbi:MAG: SH3 domain-containing protein [Phyllobacteriaceae bacterium]|nr:SH3 domain-containing protein [Phyllobacteriaceae bacterium]